ncbi:hypothetical protein COV82_03620 [Candidatus Peregrinibacteria bacterium CG11_big_fil_rev_8_21_14_0_20_46_8]|nr:MAG: hypothetical protein COV82_03620 [Candidatus Peregrinibacteria bacterium CG11_big_fil_rev_8_21_14_0_20_46_8]
MADILQFRGKDPAKDNVIELRFSQGYSDNPEPITQLCQDETAVDIPAEVISKIFKLLLTEGISPELQILIQQMSHQARPTEEQLGRFAARLIREGQTPTDNTNTASLAEKILKKSGTSADEIINDLRAMQNAADCPQLLSLFIEKLLAHSSHAREVEASRTDIREKLHATLEFGTETFFVEENRLPIVEVVMGFRRAFSSIVGIGKKNIYHTQDVAALFQIPELKFHHNARLILAVPLLPPDEEDPDRAKKILLKNLLTGDHLDAEKTNIVLDEKIKNANVIDEKSGLREIVLTAQDLIECGLAPEAVF